MLSGIVEVVGHVLAEIAQWFLLDRLGRWLIKPLSWLFRPLQLAIGAVAPWLDEF